MKKLLQMYNKYEQCYKIEIGIDNLFEKISENKKIKIKIKNVCNSKSLNGKTIIIILNSGLIELHEILSKNVIYMHVTIREKKEFKKIKKELEVINGTL